MATNFAFVLPPVKTNDSIPVIEGIRKRDLPVPHSNIMIPLPNLVVGPTPKKPNASDMAKWAKLIPADLKSRPEFRNDQIIHGSIVDQELGGVSRKVLTEFCDPDGTWYVMIRLGLQYIGDGLNKSLTNHLLALVGEGITPVRPGAFSFHRTAIELALARDDVGLAQVLGDNTGIRMGRAEATRIDVQQPQGGGRKIPGLNFSASDFSLWKMPLGSSVLACDVNDRLFRVANDRRNGKPRTVDANAPEYRQMFEALMRASQIRADVKSRKSLAQAADAAEMAADA